jgi:hypothetical protein
MIDKIRIRMMQTARPDLPFMLRPEEKDMILYEGKEYDAVTNRNGAISGICDSGKHLGVRPREFEFLEAPEWVLRVHGKFEMIRLQAEAERLNQVIDKMDSCLLRCGKELIEAENKRADMQWEIDNCQKEAEKIPNICKLFHKGCGKECHPDDDCPIICPKYRKPKYSTFKAHCNICGHETEHEQIQDDSGELITTVTSCLVCGEHDVDVDSKEQMEDEQKYFEIAGDYDMPDMPESEVTDAGDIKSFEQPEN